MSRSFKKNAILKDKNKGIKRISHHTTRAKVREVLASDKEYDEMLFPTSKSRELVNAYDVCDYILYYDYKPFIWFNRYGEQVVEYQTDRDFRAYKNK